MPLLNKNIFRGFSIRGIWGKDFDSEGVQQFAQGLSNWFNQHGIHKLVIGYDARVHSPIINQVLCDALRDGGMNVIDLGLIPTPIWNFATDFYHAQGGVMITASHNPPEYNGFKIRTDVTIYGDELQQIYELSAQPFQASQRGTYTHEDPLPAYEAALRQRIGQIKPFHVVVDGANGANGQHVPGILRRMGCTVHELYCEIDGSFPNRDPDPTAAHATDALGEKVRETHSDLGLAFDGDGDRLIIVDENGQAMMGDQILMLLAANAIQKKQTQKVAYEVLCSQVVADYITECGGSAVSSPSGYAFVHEAMLQSGAKLGGEMSGHFFLLDDTFRFDDSIVATATLLTLLGVQTKSLSQLAATLPHYFPSPTVEHRIACPDELKGEVVRSMRDYYLAKGYPCDQTDGVKFDFGNVWGLIRQSNTQPVLSLKFESKLSTEHMLTTQKEVGEQLVREFEQRGLDTAEIKKKLF